jgi:hypothetical protein
MAGRRPAAAPINIAAPRPPAHEGGNDDRPVLRGGVDHRREDARRDADGAAEQGNDDWARDLGTHRLRDSVADPGRRFDHFGLSQFASETADGDLDGLGEGVGVFVPDVSK